MRRGLLFRSCIIAVAVVAGCGKESFDVAPVHGVVSVDGKPLFQGKVMFAPMAKGEQNPGKPGWGDIASDGSFRLTTFKKNDGAVVGDHWVTIINSKEELPNDVPEFARLMLPKPVSVAAGKDNKIDIQLTSDTIEKNREDDR
jgi:hypothetical protein